MKRSLPSIVILHCFLAISSLSCAAHVNKVTDYSLPLESGPGIVICDPVATPASSDRSHFGAGCALWLQFYTGGLLELGKSPTWDGLIRARAELHRDDLQLSPTQASALTTILGVTYVAVGTLRGTDLHLTLTYTLLQEPSGKTVGPPITVTGTDTQITASLPQIAKTLAVRLGVSHPDIPAATGLTLSDLQLLEEVRRVSFTEIPASAQKVLVSLATHNPLASFMTLEYKSQTNAACNATVTTMLDLAGTNTLAWSSAASIIPLTILPHADALATLATRYPGNANLAVAETHRYRFVEDRSAEQKAAERIVHGAPNNPDGWLTYAYTLSNLSDDLRQARFSQSLTAAEWAQLNQIYPRWEEATQHAVRLDPLYGKAWLRLATAACFNSDPIVADHAMQNALKYDDDKLDVYGWALQMYQPKWYDNPIKLAKFAKLAAAETSLDAQQALFIGRNLSNSGNSDLAKQVISAFFVRRRAFIATHPNDGGAHWGLAYVLEQTGDETDAIPEYRKASALQPDNPVIHYELGNALYGPGGYDEAATEFREAIRLDPDYPDAHMYLAYRVKYLGQYDEARREIKTALRLSPAFSSAYEVLGDVDMQQDNYTDGVTDFQTAIRYNAYKIQNYDNLLTCMDKAKQFDQLITAGEAALRVHSHGDPTIFANIADAYLNKKQWDKAIAVCQTAISEDATDGLAYENLGEAYLGEGDKVKAREQWQKVLTLNDEAVKATAQKFLDQNP